VPAPDDSIRPAAVGRRDTSIAQRIADTLQQVENALAPQRRVVHAGDSIYRAGDPFGNLYLLNSGLATVVSLSADGREQVVGLKFRGDWLGFDGIANGTTAAMPSRWTPAESGWSATTDCCRPAGASPRC
jgi:CRP/FNR family transcriptional regulator